MSDEMKRDLLVQDPTASSVGNGSSVADSQLEADTELSLSAYVDGECGWLKSFFAKRHLRTSFEARKFVDELERTSGEIQRAYPLELQEACSDVSLWPRIAARIHQEERLTLLRSIPVEQPNSFFWVARLGWGGLGAVAASVFFLASMPFGAQSGLNLRSPPISSLHAGGASPEKVAYEMAAPMSQAIAQPVVNGVSAVSDRQSAYAANAPAAFGVSVAQVSRGAPGASPNQPSFYLSRGDYLNRSDYLSRHEQRALQLAAFQEAERTGRYNSPSNPSSQMVSGRNESDYSLNLSNDRKAIAPQVFEADWVRSKGRVRVLQSASGNSGILWVHRPVPSRVVDGRLYDPNIKNDAFAAARATTPQLTQVGNR